MCETRKESDMTEVNRPGNIQDQAAEPAPEEQIGGGSGFGGGGTMGGGTAGHGSDMAGVQGGNILGPSNEAQDDLLAPDDGGMGNAGRR
jgi:hypothetical protein